MLCTSTHTNTLLKELLSLTKSELYLDLTMHIFIHEPDCMHPPLKQTVPPQLDPLFTENSTTNSFYYYPINKLSNKSPTSTHSELFLVLLLKPLNSL